MDPPEDKENENEESAPENSQLGDPFDKEPHLKTPERYVIPGYDTLNAKELPENWVKLLHDSGLTMYFNPITGVATLSRPFIVTPESVKSTTIPIFAIPCLNYRYSKFAPKEPLNSKVSDADKSRVDSDTQQQDSSNCEAKKTLECPIRSVEGGGDCDGANANREDASEVADKEKEEGELTTDEDEEGENEGEDAKHGDLPPPTKRLCRRNVKEKTSPVLESNVTSQNENTAQQEAQPEKRVDNNVHNSKLLTPDEVREYCSKLFKFKRTNALTFRYDVVKTLLNVESGISVLPHSSNSDTQHFPQKLNKRIRCRVCATMQRRTATMYACEICKTNKGQPIGLCVDKCFKIYHENK